MSVASLEIPITFKALYVFSVIEFFQNAKIGEDLRRGQIVKVGNFVELLYSNVVNLHRFSLVIIASCKYKFISTI